MAPIKVSPDGLETGSGNSREGTPSSGNMTDPVKVPLVHSFQTLKKTYNIKTTYIIDTYSLTHFRVGMYNKKAYRLPLFFLCSFTKGEKT